MALNLAAPTEATGKPRGPGGTEIVQPAVPPPPAPAEIARRFPQLEILECLGRGGMGVVYKARQPQLNRWVALKILAPEKQHDAAFAARFVREAQALARLSHPAIVAVHDFGEADGLCYLIMEYVDGQNLRHLIQSRQLAPEQALAVVPKICEALQYAHEHGVVHRDIKPENVLIDAQGAVKIADFGIAKMLGRDTPQPAITLDQQVVGTPHYMAPEQVEKPRQVDHRADIYSLGVVFYEMLTGELPLGRFAPPSTVAAVDTRVDDVVLHALEKNPEQRYQQASEVKSDLEEIEREPPPLPSPPEASASASSGAHRRPVKRRELVAVGAFVVGLALIAGFALVAVLFGWWVAKPTAVKVAEPVAQPVEVSTNPTAMSAKAIAAQGFDLLLKKNDPAGARTLFEACLQEHPGYADAYHGLAVAQRETGDTANSLTNHDRAIELSPDRADYYWWQAETFQRLNDHDAAIRILERGLEATDARLIRPGRLQVALARSYRAQGNLQKALEYNEEALALNPESKWYYRERGYTYRALGDRERAEADFARGRESREEPK